MKIREMRCGAALGFVAMAVVAPVAAQEVRFRTAHTYGISGMPSDVLVGDCNGDELPDVFVSIFDTDSVAVLLNIDGVDLDSPLETAAPPLANQLTAGDFDSDGNLDLVVSRTESDFIYLMRGRGDGTFAAPQGTFVDHDPSGVAAADVNGDGSLDVAMSTAPEAAGQVNVLLGRGDGTFEYDAERARSLPAQSYDIATGDLDGDGDVDVVVPISDGNLGVLTGDGSGALDRVRLIDAGDQLFMMGVGDLDGDAVLDVVAGETFGSSLRVLLGDGDGGFIPSGFIQLGLGSMSVQVTDIDGDAVADVLVSNPGEGDVGVILGKGDGTFATPRHFLAPLRPFAAAAIDVDGDGRAELAAASQTETGGVVGLIRGVPGGFGAVEALLRGAAPGGMVFGDVDRDANLEMVVASADQEAIVVIAAAPGGGYTAPRTVLGADVAALALQDLDGDRLLDIAAVANDVAELLIARGAGDGTFSPATTIALPATASSVAIGDFNGDRIADVAAASESSVAPRGFVLTGTAAGGFSEVIELPLASGVARGLAVADLNNDGFDDLAVGNGSGRFVTLFSGAGDGFAAPLQITTPAAPLAIEAADIDGDGNADLALTGVNVVAVLFGDGTGELATGPVIGVSGLLVALAARDFTGDLRPDLAVASQNGNALLTFANNGGRSGFTGPFAIPLGRNPRTVRAGDLDGDGRYDAVATASSLWVLTNDGDAASQRGDGNGDERVDAADVVALQLQHQSGRRIAVESTAGVRGSGGLDVDGDGWVDESDLAVLPRRIFAAR